MSNHLTEYIEKFKKHYNDKLNDLREKYDELYPDENGSKVMIIERSDEAEDLAFQDFLDDLRNKGINFRKQYYQDGEPGCILSSEGYIITFTY